VTIRVDHLNTDGMRIIGEQGGIAWFFIQELQSANAATGQPDLAVSRLEAENAELRGKMPREGRLFAFDRELLITAIDARRYRVNATTLRAEPFVPPERKPAASMTAYDQAMGEWYATLNGLVGTARFMTTGALFGDRWFGLLTEKETESLPVSRTYPTRGGDELARRMLWTARVGSERGFMGQGTRPILERATPVGDRREFLQGGALRRRNEPRAVMVRNPDGLLVLHRERLGDEVPWRLARITLEGSVRWDAPLPVSDVDQLWITPEVVVMIGTPSRKSQRHEVLVSVRIADGTLHAYDLTAERPL
jgi:hypothetical protein